MKLTKKQPSCRSLTNLWIIGVIFITSGKAECPKPEEQGNVVLTNEALLKNNFPEGSEATFECANGYLRENGSEAVTCSHGKWSMLELTCKKMDCGPPRAVPNLKYEFGEDGTLFAATVKAVCDTGYKLQGRSTRQCYSTGWSGRTQRCIVVTCDKPSNITNGIISEEPHKEFPEYKDVIQYSCNEGYTLIGKKSIVCHATGQFDSSPPECEEFNDKASTTTAAATTTTTTTTTTAAATTTTTTTKTTTATSTIIIGGRLGEGDEAPNGKAAVVGSVIGTVVVLLIVIFIFYRFSKRKGSYQTGEDLRPKEELLQFQNK